jgi:hypothetical protein
MRTSLDLMRWAFCSRIHSIILAPLVTDPLWEDIEWSRALRLFPAQLSCVRSNDRIAHQFHQVSWPRAVILSSIANETELDHIWDRLILHSLLCATSLLGCGLLFSPPWLRDILIFLDYIVVWCKYWFYWVILGFCYGISVLFWRVCPEISARYDRCQILSVVRYFIRAGYFVHDCRMIWTSPTSPCWNPVANVDQTEAFVPSDQEFEDQIGI